MTTRRPFVLALVATLAAGPAPALGSSTRAGVPTKISADLLALYDSYRESQRSGTDFRPGNPLLRVVGDRVLIDAVAAGDARTLETDLVALGMRHGTVFGRMVSGELPIVAIPALGALTSLGFARPSTPSRRPGPREMPSRP